MDTHENSKAKKSNPGPFNFKASDESVSLGREIFFYTALLLFFVLYYNVPFDN